MLIVSSCMIVWVYVVSATIVFLVKKKAMVKVLHAYTNKWH